MCVANSVAIVHTLEELSIPVDGLQMIYQLSQGAFVDSTWFRGVTLLVDDPLRRAAHIDFSGDWWWVDDLARRYLELEGKGEMLSAEIGRRLFIPQPDGDGQDILDWLDRFASAEGSPIAS